MKICNGEFNADVFERRSLVCANLNVMLAVLIILAMVMSIVRMKNRFAKINRTAKESGGYRDIRVLIRLLRSGQLVEVVQLHLQSFYGVKMRVTIKKKLSGTGGARPVRRASAT